VWIDVLCKGQKVGRKRVDFMAGIRTESIMVEIKAKANLDDVDFVQALSYLTASACRVGLLVNFGATRLGIRRLAN
jgi:GxxExxY protein